MASYRETPKDAGTFYGIVPLLCHNKMSDWIYKGSDGRKKYYEKAPDKDGYVAKKQTNMSGSSGTESYKPAYVDGPGLTGWLWEHRREVVAVAIAVFGFLAMASKKWVGVCNKVIAHFKGQAKLSTKSLLINGFFALLPIVAIIAIVASSIG